MKNSIIHKLTSKGVQLKVVDGNLKVNAPKGVLTKEFLAEIKENKAYLINLISANDLITPAEIKDNYKLTPTQYFMWFTHEHLGGSRAYNITSTLKLRGNLNPELLEKAFQQVISRHEALRTVFRKNNAGEIRQHILADEASNFKLEKSVLTDTTTETLHNKIKAEYQKVFNLEKDLLISASLISLNKEEHILLFVVHHIVGDGWSLQILTKEVMIMYSDLVNNGALSPVKKLSLQYKDYSEWLNKELESDKYAKKLQYWKEQFKTTSPVLELTQSKRPLVKTYNGKIYDHEFSRNFINELNTFSKKHQMTLFMLLMGGLNGVFSRYTGQNDITLGTTVAGREHSDLESQIGLFSNALAVRTQFDNEDSFIELLQKQKHTLLKAYENKEYPFTAIVNNLSLPKNQSRSPLFDIMVLLQNHKELDINDHKGVHGVTSSEYNEIERGVSQLDISFVFVEKKESLSLNVEYNTDIYEDDFIKNLIHHFEVFTTVGLQHPESTINAIEIVDSVEKQTFLQEFNQSFTTSNELQENILNLIKSQVKIHPQHTAIVFEAEELTYEELEIYSNRLANYMEKKFHVEKGEFIGIELNRTPWTIITMLAVLKTGGVYVPIDSNYPEARKKYIQEDSNCKLVINSEILEDFKKQLEHFDKEYSVAIAPEDTAYVIYTSGSTGKPKGVQISHRSFADYAVTFKEYFQVTSKDSIVQQASISFDTSIEEIFPILISGGSLVIHNDKSDFKQLFKLCEKHKITLLSTNPFALQYLNQNYDESSFNFRTLISGGDVLKPEYIHNLWDKISVYNTYGPTESTVCATYHKIEKLEEFVPIGKPIRNRQVYILENNKTMQLAPVGVCGEIHIAGEGLSKGYLNKPELTKESFVENPWISNSSMYKTGDIGYWRSDGNIVFIGRGDNQISLRGYRIELSEIEHAILKYNGITNATVLVKGTAEEKIIIAFLEGKEIDQNDLRLFLSKELPQYMLPNSFLELEAIPMTINGKVDKKKLLAIENVEVKNKEYIAPQSHIEKELVGIWAEILQLDKTTISSEDNFFELGGHSLNIIKLLGIYENEFNVKIPFKDFFSMPTLKQQATCIHNFEETTNTKIPLVTEETYYPLAPQQTRLWITSQFSGGNVSYNMPVSFYLHGALNIPMIQKAFTMLINRHEALRTNFMMVNETPMQQVLSVEELDFSLENIDLSNKELQENSVHQLIDENYNYSFDLEKGALIRVLIAKLEEEKYLFLINLHHIISDGWSMGILIKEIKILYDSLIGQTDSQLAELRIQYKDYASWQGNQLSEKLVAELTEYWKERIGSQIPELNLPFDFPRPKAFSFKGNNVRFALPETASEKLLQIANDYEVTLFSVLFSIHSVFLHKITNQKSIIVGTSAAGRNDSDLQDIIGFFVNTLPIRFELDIAKSFKQHTLETHQNLLEDYEHGDLPFDQLISNLNIKRVPGVSPVFQTRFVYFEDQTFSQEDETVVSGIKLEAIASNHENSKFELSTNVRKIGKQIHFELEYRTDLFKPETIQQYSDNILFLIDQIIKTPEMKINQFDLRQKVQREERKNKRKNALKSMDNLFKNF